MCDSSISNPSIVANPRRASVAVQMFANGQSVLEWHFAESAAGPAGFRCDGQLSQPIRLSTLCRPFHATLPRLCYST